jgi:inhibitor of KinA
MDPVRITTAGDSAVLLELPARIDPATSMRAVALADALRKRFRGRLRDVVVGYCSVTVYFNPLELDADTLVATIRGIATVPPESAPVQPREIHVDVCYGGEYGPDLSEVAAYARASEEDVVVLHTSVTYRVYMLGFLPGFAYMATVDPRLALPRRATPRPRVAAGSVAVAAGQTGIYPSETPGGWHVIGRTHLAPYEPRREEPFLFRPGDHVTFRSISKAQFEGAHA